MEVRLFIGACCVCIIEYIKILRSKKNVSKETEENKRHHEELIANETY